MPVDLEALLEIVDKATPGPWVVTKWNSRGVITQGWAEGDERDIDPSARGPFCCHSAYSDADATFIATFDPVTVRALVEELAEARRQLAALVPAARELLEAYERIDINYRLVSFATGEEGAMLHLPMIHMQQALRDIAGSGSIVE